MPSTTIKLLANYSVDIPGEDIQDVRLSNRMNAWTTMEIAGELAKIKIRNGKVTPEWIDVKESEN